MIGEWENSQRPASAASSYSSPIGLGLEADGIRSSSRSAKSEGRGSRGSKGKNKYGKQHKYAEVGIRNVGDQIHSAYKGNISEVCLTSQMLMVILGYKFKLPCFVLIFQFFYKGNQGFLNMLKQKFLKGSSKPTDYETGSLPQPGRRQKNVRNVVDEDNKNGSARLVPTTSGNLNATNATNSANATPEMIRRGYAPEMRNEAGAR